MIAAEMGDIEEQLRGNEDKLMRQLVPRSVRSFCLVPSLPL